MEMLSSFSGDKHEFCLVVIKFKHVHSCPIKTNSCVHLTLPSLMSSSLVMNCLSQTLAIVKSFAWLS